MAVFEFRLQSLLDRRLEEQKQAEEGLRERQKELAIEQQALKALEEETETAQKLFEEKRAERVLSGKQEGSRLVAQNNVLLGLKLNVQLARSAVLNQQLLVEQAEEAVKVAQSQVDACRHEVDVLEKYCEKAERRFQIEVAYQKELEQDEIGNVMYLARRISR